MSATLQESHLKTAQILSRLVPPQWVVRDRIEIFCPPECNLLHVYHPSCAPFHHGGNEWFGVDVWHWTHVSTFSYEVPTYEEAMKNKGNPPLTPPPCYENFISLIPPPLPDRSVSMEFSLHIWTHLENFLVPQLCSDIGKDSSRTLHVKRLGTRTL